jgi:hypothetical protein
LAPTFALLLVPFCFKHFLLASFSSQAKEKKRNYREGKKCKERKEPSFKLPLCPLTFGSRFWPPTLPSHFCPPTFALLFQTLSFGIFFFSSRKKDKK